MAVAILLAGILAFLLFWPSSYNTNQRTIFFANGLSWDDYRLKFDKVCWKLHPSDDKEPVTWEAIFNVSVEPTSKKTPHSILGPPVGTFIFYGHLVDDDAFPLTEKHWSESSTQETLAGSVEIHIQGICQHAKAIKAKMLILDATFHPTDPTTPPGQRLSK